MLYCSTRGAQRGKSFEHALFSGYASDGGLYMPEDIPRASAEELSTWAKLSYAELFLGVVRKFIAREEISDADLRGIVKSALSRLPENNEVSVENLEEKRGKSTVSGDKESDVFTKPRDDELWMLELFNGPTAVFKDLALSFVASALEYFINKNKRNITIIVGTSGDTGGAAISAIEGRPHMHLVVLYPRGKISEVQYLQMVTSQHDNITVYSGEGTSDDLDVPIKALFAEPDLVDYYNLISINSVNVGRIIGQVVHFVFGYFRRRRVEGGRVEMVVPTGAAGNLVSACLARALGLPIDIVVATNTNDVVAKFVETGRYFKQANVVQCSSNAMDIQVPYNIERLIYLYSDKDTAMIRKLLAEWEAVGDVTFPEDVVKKMKQALVGACSYDEAAIRTTIRSVQRDYDGYLVCPHTAQGVALHYLHPTSTPRLYVAPAHAAKFTEAMRKALLPSPDDSESVKAWEEVEETLGKPFAAIRRLADQKGTKELMMNRGTDYKQTVIDKLEQINSSWLS